MNDRNSEANTKAIDSLLEFRDGQVFRQRGARGARYDMALHAYERAAVKSETTLAAAQSRPGRDHRRRAGRGHDPRRRGRRVARHDGRRLRPGQRLSGPALHAAQLPRRRLPQHQAVADRSRADDGADGGQARDRGPAGRAGAARSARARSRFAMSISATTAARPILLRCRFPRGAGRARSRSSGRAAPANRRSPGCCSAFTTWTPVRSRSTARMSAK